MCSESAGSSPSQRIAVCSPRFARWRSRQLAEALSVPSSNQRICRSSFAQETSFTFRERRDPVEPPGLLGPEAFRVFHRPAVHRLIGRCIYVRALRRLGRDRKNRPLAHRYRLPFVPEPAPIVAPPGGFFQTLSDPSRLAELLAEAQALRLVGGADAAAVNLVRDPPASARRSTVRPAGRSRRQTARRGPAPPTPPGCRPRSRNRDRRTRHNGPGTRRRGCRKGASRPHGRAGWTPSPWRRECKSRLD